MLHKKDPTKVIIREITKADVPLLEDFLFLAIYIPAGNLQPDKSIIFTKELYHYIEDFGRMHDLGFVALINNKVIGMIWTRLFAAHQRGYGFVDDQTPELSMAISPEFRSQGIGGKLFEKMLIKLQKSNFKKVSLSVDDRNFAFQLYLKSGFVKYKTEGTRVVMLREL